MEACMCCQASSVTTQCTFCDWRMCIECRVKYKKTICPACRREGWPLAIVSDEVHVEDITERSIMVLVKNSFVTLGAYSPLSLFALFAGNVFMCILNECTGLAKPFNVLYFFVNGVAGLLIVGAFLLLLSSFR